MRWSTQKWLASQYFRIVNWNYMIVGLLFSSCLFFFFFYFSRNGLWCIKVWSLDFTEEMADKWDVSKAHIYEEQHLPPPCTTLWRPREAPSATDSSTFGAGRSSTAAIRVNNISRSKSFELHNVKYCTATIGFGFYNPLSTIIIKKYYLFCTLLL